MVKGKWNTFYVFHTGTEYFKRYCELNGFHSTEEETGIPWRSAYLKMTLLEATYFVSQRHKVCFLFFTGVGLFYTYICVQGGKQAYSPSLEFLAREDPVCPFFNTFEWRHVRL